MNDLRKEFRNWCPSNDLRCLYMARDMDYCDHQICEGKISHRRRNSHQQRTQSVFLDFDGDLILDWFLFIAYGSKESLKPHGEASIVVWEKQASRELSDEK